MDDATPDVFGMMDESTMNDSDVQTPEMDDGKEPRKRRWRGLSALKGQAGVQDKLLEKSVHPSLSPSLRISPV